jgi:hypothetical protein
VACSRHMVTQGFLEGTVFNLRPKRWNESATQKAEERDRAPALCTGLNKVLNPLSLSFPICEGDHHAFFASHRALGCECGRGVRGAHTNEKNMSGQT